MNKIEIRTRILRPGDVVSVRHCQAVYPLPSGLAEGSRVTVLRLEIGYAAVVDENGHPWRVSFTNIEMPQTLWWKGRWIDGLTHPEGKKALAQYLEQTAAVKALGETQSTSGCE